MDIDLLSKMVKELILDNDKVVLPGLGSFVAEVIPASFSDKGYTINPPYRRLYFRSKPVEGDSLAVLYASSNGVDVEMADRIIRDFVAELKTVLYSKKNVVFPGLGRLRATKENIVFFVADEDLDIYPEGLGLEPISLKTHQETPEEVDAAIAELKAIVDEPIDLEPEIEQEMDSEPQIEQVTEQEVSVEPLQKQSGEERTKNSGFWKTFLKCSLWILLVIIVLLVAFVAVSRLCPEFTDSILYTPEELEILSR